MAIWLMPPAPYTQIPMPSERRRHQPVTHRAESELPSSVEASGLHLRAWYDYAATQAYHQAVQLQRQGAMPDLDELTTRQQFDDHCDRLTALYGAACLELGLAWPPALAELDAESAGQEQTFGSRELPQERVADRQNQPAMSEALTSAPDIETLMQWEAEGGCEATDGCWVEVDGKCPHGQQSWLLELGLI